MLGRTIVRALTWSVLRARRVALQDLVDRGRHRERRVDADDDVAARAPRACISSGCQSAPYFISKRLMVKSSGGAERPARRDDPAEVAFAPASTARARSACRGGRSANAASPGAGAAAAGPRRCRRGEQDRPPPGRYNGTALKQDNSSGYAALRERRGDCRRAVSGGSCCAAPIGASYLQGLLTNDIAALTPGTGCYAAMLTAQGRMITDMRVLELGDAVLLDVPRALAAPIRDHLDRFVFCEDVQVEDVTRVARRDRPLRPARAGRAAGGAGSTAASRRAASLDARPRRRTRRASSSAATSRRRRDRPDRRCRDAARSPPAARRRRRRARPTRRRVEAVRIESGRPRFGVDMDADTIPLEAGLEDRAISRSKGCYVGQEVIVRVQDRGHGRVARGWSG